MAEETAQVDPIVNIGRRIKVYWPLDKAWYEGVIEKYDAGKNQYHVQYDDGETEKIKLDKGKFELIPTADSPAPAGRPKRERVKSGWKDKEEAATPPPRTKKAKKSNDVAPKDADSGDKKRSENKTGGASKQKEDNTPKEKKEEAPKEDNAKKGKDSKSKKRKLDEEATKSSPLPSKSSPTASHTPKTATPASAKNVGKSGGSPSQKSQLERLDLVTDDPVAPYEMTLEDVENMYLKSRKKQFLDFRAFKFMWQQEQRLALEKKKKKEATASKKSPPPAKFEPAPGGGTFVPSFGGGSVTEAPPSKEATPATELELAPPPNVKLCCTLLERDGGAYGCTLVARHEGPHLVPAPTSRRRASSTEAGEASKVSGVNVEGQGVKVEGSKIELKEEAFKVEEEELDPNAGIYETIRRLPR